MAANRNPLVAGSSPARPTISIPRQGEVDAHALSDLGMLDAPLEVLQLRAGGTKIASTGSSGGEDWVL